MNDVKALRTIVRMRKQDPNDRAEAETILETYMQADAVMFGGVRIIESLAMVDQVEDWSRVRSPGRARRRRWKHPQNIRMIHVPKPHAISMDGGRTLIMHLETVRQLRQMTSALLPEPSALSPEPSALSPVPLFDRMGLSVVRPFPLFSTAGVS